MDNVATPAELDRVPPSSAPGVKHGGTWNNASLNEPIRDGTALFLNRAIDQQIKGPGEFTIERSQRGSLG